MINSLSQPLTAVANLALISPVTNIGYQPISSIDFSNIAQAFYFHAEMDNDVDLEAEVTDNFLGDNTFVNDHIVLKPPVVMVRAVQGEVTMVLPSLGPLGVMVQNILPVISAFSPSFSVSAQNVINQTTQAYQEINAAANGASAAINSLSGATGANVITAHGQIQTNPTQTQQQTIFSQIYKYWFQQSSFAQPSLFNIQTPYAIFTPMALVSCKARQNAETVTVSEFTLTFKMVRIINDAAQQTTSIGRAANLAAPLVYNGNSVPTSSPSLSSQLPSGGF